MTSQVSPSCSKPQLDPKHGATTAMYEPPPPQTSGAVDDRYSHFRVDKLDEVPDGYPRLATFIDSDVNLHLYRRFGHLRNRLLLYRQDELCELEATLSKLDEEHEATNPYRLSARRYDEAQPDGNIRKDLMKSIDVKLKQYDDLLQRERTILAMPKASQQNHRSLFDYIWNEQPLAAEEQEFVLYKDDFVALLSDEEGWLDFLIRALIALLPIRLLEFLLSSKSSKEKTDNPNVMVLSNNRARMLIRMLLVTCSVMILILPMILLSFVDMSTQWRVGVISIFMLTFAAAVSLTTQAKKHEIFMGVATYCAVLVVFLGNL